MNTSQPTSASTATAADALVAEVRAQHQAWNPAPLRQVLERLHTEVDARARARAIEAGQILAGVRLDPDCVTAVVATPLVLAAGTSVSALREELGPEVAGLVAGIERLSAIHWDRLEEEKAETLRKTFMAMAHDVRVVLAVLAMRVSRLRALRGDDTPDEAARRLASETLEVLAPLANRLGIWQLKWELEDWSLRALEPETFAELTRLLSDKREQREAFIASVIATLRARLEQEGVDATVTGRPKHIYSIYKKMQRKQVSFDHIYDISAVRIITGQLADCYAALGLVHSLWVPLPDEFDDYIARPKNNRYQSLHTAVVGPEGRAVEVQIRTQQMHQYAEFGVAAHWAYKEQRRAVEGAQDKFMVLRQLMDWERELGGPRQLAESLKSDVFADQVYVFTPGGDVIDLPAGATPLDFAYRIHTMVGHRCRGARVNDQIRPLDHELRTGDRVEILTHKHPRPSRDWMNPAFGFLKSSSARTKVRQWYRQQGRETAIVQGRELVEKELSRLDLHRAESADIAERLGYPSVEDMYAAVGYGDRSPQSVASAALQIERAGSPAEEVDLPPSVAPSTRPGTTSGLRLHGVDDVLGERARCCNPVPGDAVVGFVSRGRGIVIHRRDCANVRSSPEPERLVDIDWGPAPTERHTVEIEVRAQDRPGLMRDISNLISNTDINIRSARAETHQRGEAVLRLQLDLRSAEQMVRVLQLIDRFEGVLEVRRRGH